MRRTARPRAAAAALAVALAGPLAAACATGGARAAGAPAPAPAPRDGVLLVVRDEGLTDVDLYAVDDGARFRIGSVAAGDSAVVPIGPEHLAEGRLRVIALPVGGLGRATTGPVLVQPGQTVTFTVEPDLAASTVLVR